MKTSKYLTQAAIIAALYVCLCLLQNLLLPNSASMAVQFRAAEALCILALFTPAALPGLALGCLLFNLTQAGALPLDFFIGTAASFLAAAGMRLLRNVRFWKLPILSLCMPALVNGILVGAELTIYIEGSSFWFNALCVGAGELAVLFSLGLALYGVLSHRGLGNRIFR
ncbi:MAG: QueT transporter family protein [Oscillospiraceae bacterium]|nr:QueT transporter family protein [Oscillospiraceae bacterium]